MSLSIQSFLRTAAVVPIVASFLVFIDPAASRAAADPIVFAVKASPSARFETRMTVRDEPLSEALNELAASGSTRLPSPSDVYVFARRAYRLGRDGSLIDLATNEAYLPSPALRVKLQRYARQIRGEHYGELVPWDEARSLVPLKSVLTLVDLETGMTFRAQRRAGSDHADVQPIGKGDTAIMKRVYNGRWSWDRRAVLVRMGDRTLAASMHGMPHGGDGIPNNGFSGHFCVHFLGSSTHRSDFVDPEHQLMVHKAAGDLDGYFARADVLTLSDAFFAAVRMKEREALPRLFSSPGNPQIKSFINTRATILKMHRRWSSRAANPEAMLEQEVPVVVWIYRENGRKEQTTFRLLWKRLSPADPWRLEQVEGWNET